MTHPALITDPLKHAVFKRTSEPSAEVAFGQGGPAGGPGSETALLPAQPPTNLQLVAFNVGALQIGIDILQVSCLVRMLEITRIPRSSRYVEGIINVRGQIVPVISLHRLFRATYSVDLLNTYILVGRAQSQPVGLILDSVTQLHDVDPGQLEPSSPSDPLAALLPWVVKHDEGILFILDLNQLVALKDAPALVARIGADALDGEEKPISPEVRAVLRQRAAQLRQVSTGEGVESRTFFTFALGQEKYAVSADNAERVLVPPEIVSVPGTPHQFAGMMNYSGDVLWVLDPKTLLGLTPSLPGNAERVLILDYGGDRFGLLIDTAFAVASVPASAIRGSLVGADKARDDYVAGEIYWRDELIAILDFSTLSAEKVLHTVE